MLVVKLGICTAIVLICTILGVKKSKKYETREKVIIDFITTFKSIEKSHFSKIFFYCVKKQLNMLRQIHTAEMQK